MRVALLDGNQIPERAVDRSIVPTLLDWAADLPALPAGTKVHLDLTAFADWLLAQPAATKPSA